MWKIWHESQSLGIRPSAFYGVTHPLAAWMLDRGAYRWVKHVQSKLDEVAANVSIGTDGRDVSGLIVAERQRIFAELMRLPLTSVYGTAPIEPTIAADGTRLAEGD